jgi:hypothetical protein
MKSVAPLLLGAFLLLQTVQRQPWDVKCYAEIYAANPEYLKVVVDTNGLPSNVLLRGVRFDVTVIGPETADKQFWFTNGNITALLPGKVYVQYFRLGVRSARGLKVGGKLFWSGGAAGAAGCESHRRGEKFPNTIEPSILISSDPILERDPITVGQVPSPVPNVLVPQIE